MEAQVEVVRATRTAAVCRLRGEFNLGSVELLNVTLASCWAKGRFWIELDMRAVTFLDFASLTAVLAADMTCTAHGGGLVLAHPSLPVRDVLNLSALEQMLTVRTEPED